MTRYLNQARQSRLQPFTDEQILNQNKQQNGQ